MMFRVECKNAARLAATVGLGLTLSLGVTPAFALGSETLDGVASTEGSVTPAAAGVAQIGNETYASFEEAMNAVPDGAKTTIKLLSDCTLYKALTLTKTKEVVLDLNGSTLTVRSNSSIRVQGLLTIRDSSKGESGTISGVGCSKNGVVQTLPSKSAKLTLDGGQIVSDGTYALSLNNLSSFAMNGGTVKAKTPLRLQNASRAEILGGTLEPTEESGNAITLTSEPPVTVAPAITVGTANSFDEPQIKGAINIATGVSPKGEDIALVGGTIKGVTGKLPEGSKLTSHFTSNISAALPDGKYCTQQDEYWLVTDKAPEGSVAVIGGSAFDTLQAAIDSVTDGQATEITLLANTNENITIPEGKNIVLDLGGCQVTSANGLENGKGTITVAENANLTVKGSGVVDTTVNGTAALVNNGTVTINGGTFTRSAEAEGNSYYVIDNQGTMTINGGTVSNNSKISSLVRNAGYAENTLTITGGEFQNDFIAIKNDECGVLNISGGKITSTFSQSVQNWGKANLSGGQFLGGPVATWSQSEDSTGDGHRVTGETTITGDAVIYKNVETHNINGGAAPSVTVTGGTVKGSFAKYEATIGSGGVLSSSQVDINDRSSSIVVSGGNFASPVPDAILAAGSELVTNDDGTVTVAGENTVAVMDGKGYTSFTDAVAAAKSGSTITLIKDQELTSSVTIPVGVTVDLGRNTLSVSENAPGNAFGIVFTSGESVIKNGVLLDKRTAAGPALEAVNSASLNLQDVEVNRLIPSSGSTNIVEVQSGASLTLDSGAKVSEVKVDGRSGFTFGVVVLGSSTEAGVDEQTATKLTVNEGASISSYAFAVSGNGGGSNHNTLITINGGSVKSEAGAAIYHPQYGKLVINGGVVQGSTGVEMRAGVIEVNAGTLKGGDGEFKDPTSNPGGNTSDNVALAIVQHTTKLPIVVNVNGGSFEATQAFLQANPEKNGASDVEEIEISVSDGSFSGGVKSENFSAKDGDGFISGGSFTESPVAYVTKDSAVKIDLESSFEVLERGNLPAGTYVVPEGAEQLTSKDFESGLVVTVDPVTGQATATRPQTPTKGEHAVKVDEVEGGKVSVTPTTADEGDEVTIAATPDKGQEVRSVAVTTKDGKAVKVAKGDKANTWTFDMPDGEVTVKVTFGCDGGELCPTHKFDDVLTGAWYHDVVDWAVEEGLLSGYADGKLGPDGTLSRAQLATVLWRQAGEPEAEGGLSFADCDPEAFYAEAVAWADEAGIIAGYGDGTNFGPEDPVTREQLATILWRQAGEPEGKGDLGKYPDGGDATDYAVPALEWAVDTGVLSGFGDGTLAPGGVLSRAMLAAMLQRIA